MDSLNAFEEPRAWALQWEGAALSSEAGEPLPSTGPQRAWTPRWRHVDLPRAGGLVSSNGHHPGGWREPRAWSLAWDATVALNGTAVQAAARASEEVAVP